MAVIYPNNDSEDKREHGKEECCVTVNVNIFTECDKKKVEVKGDECGCRPDWKHESKEEPCCVNVNICCACKDKK